MKIDFSANFHLTHDFFGVGSLDTPKIGKRKKKFTNINLRGCKIKKNVKGWFFTDKTGLKIFVFINAMIFAYVAFVKNTPLWVKTLLKSEKNIFQISHLIFWMQQAAKYLIYDFTFTFSFFFI